MSTSIGTSAQKSSGGIGFLGLLTIVFVVLKALGYLNWSWWLVFLPIWGPLSLVLAIAALGGILVFMAKYLDKREAKKGRARLAELRAQRQARYVGREPIRPVTPLSDAERQDRLFGEGK